ncbi:hypothetical protein D3C76_1764520 [compost metagenome]
MPLSNPALAPPCSVTLALLPAGMVTLPFESIVVPSGTSIFVPPLITISPPPGRVVLPFLSVTAGLSFGVFTV